MNLLQRALIPVRPVKPESETYTAFRWKRWHLPAAVAFFVVGVGLYLWVLRTHLPEMWVMIDLAVYRWGGLTTWHHATAAQLYTGAYQGFLPFIYPPFAAEIFSGLAHFSMPRLEQMVWTVSLVSLFASTWISWGILGMARNRQRVAATLAVGAFALWLEPVQQTLAFGQVNLVLMLLTLGDLALSDRRWYKGVGIGLAAGFKLTPAIFIVYLAMTRRFRAALVSTGVLVATVAAGYAFLPSQAKQYWDGGFMVGSKVGQSYLANQSISGELYRLVAQQDVTPIWAPIAVVVAVAGLILAAHYSKLGRELEGILVCAGTMLLVSPISWTHHYVWVVPALVFFTDAVLRIRRHWAWTYFAAGLALFFAWMMQLNGQGNNDPIAGYVPTGLIWYVPHRGPEDQWGFLESIAGNYYSILVAVLLVCAGVYYWRRLRTPAEPPAPAETEPVTELVEAESV